MNIHKNARLTPLRREEMARLVCSGQLSKAEASRQFGVTAKVVKRWSVRYEEEGPAGMVDRSSRPHRFHNPTDPSIVADILSLRRHRLCGQHIALRTGVSPATVSRVLRRAGLSRLKDLAPAEPVVRYEHAHPGEMIHLDIKRLGRFERVGPPHHRRSHGPVQLTRRRLGVRPCLRRRRLTHGLHGYLP